MYRVVTRYRTGSSRPTVEHGPWHQSRETAEYWAEVLREHGYTAQVETQRGAISAETSSNDNSDLAAALASMA